MSEIRYDRLHDVHVIIAPERLRRPDIIRKKPAAKTKLKECPFCEGNEAMTPSEIFALRAAESFPDEPGWRTRVVPNLYKALQIETPDQAHFGMFEYRDGFGAHEVIIDTPRHPGSMAEWDEGMFVDWLSTLGARVADLRNDNRMAFISLFKNEGADAGATQPHAHTQLIGMPLIPKRWRDYYQRAWHHYVNHGKALLSEMSAQEIDAQERLVAQRGDFAAYCPFAGAFPFEVLIAPEQSGMQIDTLRPGDLHNVAKLLRLVMTALQKQLGTFAFNLEIATPPLQPSGIAHEMFPKIDAVAPFWIRIMPRLYRLGGFEVSTQTMINPVVPEEAARLLRGALNHG